jgi:hypothetical protein
MGYWGIRVPGCQGTNTSGYQEIRAPGLLLRKPLFSNISNIAIDAFDNFFIFLNPILRLL